MSELIQKQDNRATIRWKLLTGVSALALTAYVSSTNLAKAEDADRSQIWIELGGQWSGLADGQETFSPPIMAVRPSIFAPSQNYERPPRHGIDEEGKISFQPEDSDWNFSASVRYGRSSTKRHHHQQTYPKPIFKYYTFGSQHYTATAAPLAAKMADTVSLQSERHMIMDFQAGKDVGLGLFGSRDATSVLSAGIRFAQFESKSNIALKSDPDWSRSYKYFPILGGPGGYVTFGQAFHSNLASMTARRSFRGVGPSVSWAASAPLMGNIQDGAIVADWGLNASLLFGRQRTRTHHQTTAKSFELDRPILTKTGVPHTVSRFTPPDQMRSRNVRVTNIGGSIGVSWQLQNFKMSFGYRADLFLNAMDGGIDARKDENRGFFGPYASISVGLGD